MENYSIYTHSVDLDGILSKVNGAFPKAAVAVSKQDDLTIIAVTIKGGLFTKKQTLVLKYRQRLFPSYHLHDVNCGVSNQFMGMYNFVYGLPAVNEETKELLLKKIETLNSEIAFVVEPSLSPAMQHLLLELTIFLKAIVFIQPGMTLAQSSVQHFADSAFQLLLDVEGNTGNGKVDLTISSRFFDDPMPATDEQITRKERTEQLLRQRGIKINLHLPVVPEAALTQVRDRQDIIERAYCLTVIAAKGEGVAPELLEQKIEELDITGFTPMETYIYTKAALSEQERANATWRYESLNVLLWSLGLVEDLVYPSVICDVPAIVDTVINQSRLTLESRAGVRDTAEILEELDKIYRMHWACVDARLHSITAGGDLNPSVVYERHYALNWLTCYQDQAWDDVSTDT